MFSTNDTKVDRSITISPLELNYFLPCFSGHGGAVRIHEQIVRHTQLGKDQRADPLL
jgi:hypothetical protein